MHGGTAGAAFCNISLHECTTPVSDFPQTVNQKADLQLVGARHQLAAPHAQQCMQSAL
jgi:NADPH-dependent ferric siderophore reductase